MKTTRINRREIMAAVLGLPLVPPGSKIEFIEPADVQSGEVTVSIDWVKFLKPEGDRFWHYALRYRVHPEGWQTITGKSIRPIIRVPHLTVRAMKGGGLGFEVFAASVEFVTVRPPTIFFAGVTQFV